MSKVVHLKDRAPHRFADFDTLVNLVLDVMADGGDGWSEKELVEMVRRLQRVTRLEN